MKALDHDGTDHLIDKIYDLINSGGSADYIVEEGTSGIWTYRKWASGIAECWGYQQYSNLSVTRQYGSVYLTAVGSPQAGPNFPFTISNPVVQRTVQGGNQWILSGGDPSTTNSGEFWICRPASATDVNVKVGIYAKGLWKEFMPSAVSSNYALSADFIVEQGTSGIWTYRKWASGIAECWGTTTFSGTANQSWGSYIKYATVPSVNYPFTFVAITEKTALLDSGGAWSTGCYNQTNSSTGDFYVCRPDSNSVSGRVYYNIKGLWK